MSESKASNNGWFWTWQVLPPSIMLGAVFGTWCVGTVMVITIPFLYSFYRIVSLGVRRRFDLLLRPALTFCFAAVVVVMGNYYAGQSMLYVDTLAQTIQEQCNRDGYCSLPPGSWKQTSHFRFEETYCTRSPGLVRFSIWLTFKEPAPSANPSSSSIHPTEENNQAQSVPTFKRYTAFHLVRNLEDFDYNVYGGVGRPLTSGGHGFSP